MPADPSPTPLGWARRLLPNTETSPEQKVVTTMNALMEVLTVAIGTAELVAVIVAADWDLAFIQGGR